MKFLMVDFTEKECYNNYAFFAGVRYPASPVFLFTNCEDYL